MHTNFSECRKKLPAIRNFLCLKQIPEKRGKVLILKILDCNDLMYNNLECSIVIQNMNEIEFIFTF